METNEGIKEGERIPRDLIRLENYIKELEVKSKNIVKEIKKVKNREIDIVTLERSLEKFTKEVEDILNCIKILYGRRIVCIIKYCLIVLMAISSFIPSLVFILSQNNEISFENAISSIGGLYLFIGSILLIFGISKWREKDCIGLGLGGYADRLERTIKSKQVQYGLDYFKKSSKALIFFTYGFLFQILPDVVRNLSKHWILLALIAFPLAIAISISWILKLHKCKDCKIDMN